MPNYKLISDSSCDLSKSYVLENDIDVVPFSITFDGEKYYREGPDIEYKELYERMKGNNIFPKTSLPSTQDYYDVFEKYAKDKIDIICLCLTSKFSGSYQSAVNAKNMILEEYSDIKIEVIDSQNVSATQGFLLMQMVDMKNLGFEFEKLIEVVEKIKHDRKIFVTFDTLEFLQKGGRMGKASALAGSLLNIKPIILFNDGELHSHAKARGRKKSLAELVNIIEKEFETKDVKNYELMVLSNDCAEDTQTVLNALKEKGFKVNIPLVNVGATITVHSGVGLVGIGYFRKYDTI